MEDTGSWLPCIGWSGAEGDLPLGSTKLIPGLTIMKFVYRWIVLDAETEEGIREVKKADLQSEDIIIGAKLNHNSIEKARQAYGPRFIMIQPANGSPALTRDAWRARYGTDGFELLAIKEQRSLTSKPGVRF